MNNSVIELSQRLVKALDKNYNVIDMDTVLEVIISLEKTTVIITKELLEHTRLGKTVNELRKKTESQRLARRAKELLKRWRTDITLPERNIQINGVIIHKTIPINPVLNNHVHKDVTRNVSPNISSNLKTHSSPARAVLPESGSQSPMDNFKGLKRVDQVLLLNERSQSPHQNLKRKDTTPEITLLPSKRPRRNGIIDRSIESNINSNLNSQINSKLETTPEKEKRHKKHKKEKKSKKHKSETVEVLNIPNSVDNSPRVLNHNMVPDIAQKAELTFSGKFEKEGTHITNITNSKQNAAEVTQYLPDSRSMSPGQAHSQSSNGSASNNCSSQSHVLPTVPAVKPEPKKRGRKKGSKVNQPQDKQHNLISDLKKRIENMSGKSKIKTTAEIVADLQNRSDKRQSGTAFVIPEDTKNNKDEPFSSNKINFDGNFTTKLSNHIDFKSPLVNKEQLRINPQNTTDVLSTSISCFPIKSGYVNNVSGNIKEIKSEEDEEFVDVVVDVSEKTEPQIKPDVNSVEKTQPNIETVEEILSRLPKLDRDSIEWEDNEIPCSCIEKLPDADDSFLISELIPPALKKSIFDVDYEEEHESAVVVQTESVPKMPVYIIDPDCPAKICFVDNIKHVTQYHLHVLHNKCVANINGTWHEGLKRAEPAVPDFFPNVVPNYSHLVQEKIKKDFSSINFSKFRRIKLCKKGLSYSRLKHCANVNSISESDEDRRTKQVVSDRVCCSSGSSGCEHDLNEVEASEVQLDACSLDPPDLVDNLLAEQVAGPNHKNCDLVHTNIQFSERNSSLEVGENFQIKSPVSDRSHLSSPDDDGSLKSPRECCNSSGFHESEDVPSSNDEILADPTYDLPEDENGQLKSLLPPLSEESSNIAESSFREWFEVVQKTSYNEELLTILPYVVID